MKVQNASLIEAPPARMLLISEPISTSPQV